MRSPIREPGAGAAGLLGALLLLGAGCGGGAASVHGRVVVTGAPGAVKDEVTLEGPTAASVLPAADGTWQASHLPEGTYLVMATVPSTRTGRQVATVAIPATGSVAAPTLTFQAVGALAGTVTDAAGSPPPAGTVVAVVGTGAVAHPDAAGAFRLDAVPTGHRTVVATAPDGARAEADGVTVTYDATTSVPALALAPVAAPSATLTGRVTVTGEADASGIAVTLSGPASAAAVTAADGTYHFTGLPTGHYLVTAAAGATLEGTRLAAVAVTGAGATAPELTFTPTGSVRGQATAGAVTGNAGIAVLVQGTGGTAVGVTDDGGAYLVQRVPVGPVTVTALRAGEVAAGAVTGAVAWKQTTAVAALTLAAAPAGPAGLGDFQGQAFLEGDGATGIQVTLTGGAPLPSAVTGSDGTFILPGVPIGVYAAHLAIGPYQDTLPQLLVLPGDAAQRLYQGTLTPLTPVTLQRGARVATTGTVTRVVGSADGRWLLAFSPAYVGQRIGRLYLVDLKQGGAVALDTTVADEGFRFAGARDTVLYLAGASNGTPVVGDLVALDPVTRSARTLGSLVGLDGIHVSGDGRWVSFVSVQTLDQTGSLYVAGVDQGSATRLDGHVALGASRVTAGGQVLYARHTPASTPQWALESVPLAGGTATHLADGADGHLLVLSPDQKTAYFSTSLGQVDAVPVAGGATVMMASGVRCLGLTPDGKALLCFGGYAAGAQGTPLERIDLTSHDVTVLDPDAAFGPLVFSPDHTRVACPRGGPGAADLDVAALDGSGAKRVAQGVALGACVFSPDGRTLVVADHAQRGPTAGTWQADLARIDLATGGGTLLATDVDGAMAPVISADGYWVDFLGAFDPGSGVGTAKTVPLSGGSVADLVSHATGVFGAAGQSYTWHGGETAALGFRDGVYRLPGGAP